MKIKKKEEENQKKMMNIVKNTIKCLVIILSKK